MRPFRGSIIGLDAGGLDRRIAHAFVNTKTSKGADPQ
jgi:hypothetical protein